MPETGHAGRPRRPRARTPLRPASLVSPRLVVPLLLVLGVITAVVSYRVSRERDRANAFVEFRHAAAMRHALTREIFGHYEDALFGLSGIFAIKPDLGRKEFEEAVSRLQSRLAGAGAFEWVPLVGHDQRDDVERRQTSPVPGQPFFFTEAGPSGALRRAPDHPFYYPILYIHPLAGNERALGFNLAQAPTRELLQRARDTRRMLLSPSLRLVQEPAENPGVIMVLPVFRLHDDGFAGFLQCVFRVRELLEAAHRRQTDSNLDLMFVDASESEAERRTLLYREGVDRGPGAPPTEAEFRRGPHLELAVPFGQRDWRVLYRPAAGWIESQELPLRGLRAGAMVVVAALLASIVHLLGRRTESVRREVAERTAELADSRRLLAGMLHALPGMAYRCNYDDQMSVLFLSDGAREMTGWTPAEFISGRVHFRDCIHPDDLTRVREMTRQALQSHADLEIEYRIRTKSGGEKWVLSRGRGIYTDDGRLDFFEGLAIDITAQKRAEAARIELERKLLEGQKLESLGLLAGGIAHDFNNLLISILGRASLARGEFPDGADGQRHLQAIETAAQSAAELCRQMLAYAGKGRFVIEPIDVSVLVQDLLPLVRISIARQAALRLDLMPDPPRVMADATQLRQIVMNIVLNAADAIGSAGGEITLTTGVRYADGGFLRACVSGAELPPGDYVFLEVRDNGCGMPPEVREKIFDPFFTTKFTGRGLGLAAVLGIVRGHAGALRVESTPGEGSFFQLLLPPVAGAAVPPAPVSDPKPAAAALTGRVLVVDDEEQVRVVLMSMLTSFGMTAVPAANGKEAMDEFQRNPAEWDLVLLDLLMPVMNGEQTLRALRGVRPDLRVLLVSGFSEGDVLGRMGGGPGIGFLAKPFTRGALREKLAEMLG